MSVFKLTIAYDGTGFVGWQRQAEGVSIQGLIEDACAELDGQPVAVAGAGRTDAGVHALGQVASLVLERAIARRRRGARAECPLPPAVRYSRRVTVPDGFQPVRRPTKVLPLSDRECPRAQPVRAGLCVASCLRRARRRRHGGGGDVARGTARLQGLSRHRERDARRPSGCCTRHAGRGHGRPTVIRIDVSGNGGPTTHGQKHRRDRWSRSGCGRRRPVGVGEDTGGRRPRPGRGRTAPAAGAVSGGCRVRPADADTGSKI